MQQSATLGHENGLEIAIIGMSGRFPGANHIEQFWRNLQDGVESISVFTHAELQAAGISPTVLSDPNYVKARGVLENEAWFDASFFSMTPKEAEITDPQHRLFLECAWEALETAGYDTASYNGSIGVYGGAYENTYLLNLHTIPGLVESVGRFPINIGNEKDYLTTRVSYKLNLNGPSLTVQTACSTSLVAIYLASHDLLSGACDMALAGGVSIRGPQKAGYVFQPGGIFSPDGHCRAFDANAQGTVTANGVGVVVLKRLADALTDGDSIQAIIKGSTINNDAALKVGYTAPSVDGQARVIRAAQAMAEVEPETITYIETHGTGTTLGDPIEIAALTRVFQVGTQETHGCAIGSVKTNIGHMHVAAGVAGLIKTVLALKHGMVPPSLHFDQPNPKIDFDTSPFYVNTRLAAWKAGRSPRRAGVSSFGIGGTNAHVILEEAPRQEPTGTSRPWHLLVLSAKTSSALETATVNLTAHFKRHPGLNLADVAYTLQVGRSPFEHRRILRCQNLPDAVAALEPLDPKRVLTNAQPSGERPVVFMFTGQGGQYVNMAVELYQHEPTFRQQVDLCAQLLQPRLGLDLRQVLYPELPDADPAAIEAAARQLDQTWLTQPALFVIEYALARLWMEWGVQPQAMIGHSIGEYVAACLAGVFSLEQALDLVAVRGRLMQSLPTGAMLAVFLPEAEVQPLLHEQLSLAAVNSPLVCVVSGPSQAVAALAERLVANGVGCRRLHTSHAFHSTMMDPILESFMQQVNRINLHPPQILYLSNVTGTWITAAETTQPSYWARHLRQTVRFAEGMEALLRQPDRVLLEVGPGHGLSSLARQHPHKRAEQLVLSSLRHPQEKQADEAVMLDTLGRLWLAGVAIDWPGVYAHERRYRLPLPTYPFERQRYWIEPSSPADAAQTPQAALRKKPDMADWFSIPSWKRSMPPVPLEPGALAQQRSRWLVFSDACGVGAHMVKRLVQEGQDVITVRVGAQFSRVEDDIYTLNPRQPTDYDALLNELCQLDKLPQTLVHLWSVTPHDPDRAGPQFLQQAQDAGFYSLLFLAQALANRQVTTSLHLGVISNHMQQVAGTEGTTTGESHPIGPL